MNDPAVGVGAIVLLGVVLLIVSRRVFGTVLAPMGLYALAWMGVSVMYWLAASIQNGLFFEPEAPVFDVVLVGMVVFSVGCLMARVVRQRQRGGMPSWPEPSPAGDSRLRWVLARTEVAAFLSPVMMFLYAWRLGIVGVGGDAARRTFIEGLGSSIGGPTSILLGYAFWVLGVSFEMLALLLALYVVFFRRGSFLWLIVPVGCGVGIDYLQQGRYWAGAIAVMCMLAIGTRYHLWRSRRHSSGLAFSGDSAGVHTREPRLASRNFGWWRSTVVLAMIAVISVSVFVITAQRREGLSERVEWTVVLGPITVPKFAMGPVLYVIAPLASMNSYLARGGPSRLWYGSIGISGFVDLVNYIPGRTRYAIIAANPQWAFDYDAPEAIGPFLETNAYHTYFRQAMDDFGWLGLLIYPFLAGYLSTRLLCRMQHTGNVRDVCLWLLAAYTVAMTPLRWQLIESLVWGSGFLVVATGILVDGRRRIGLLSPRRARDLRAGSRGRERPDGS